MLTEIRHRRKPDDMSGLRAKLIDFEVVLSAWTWDARETNECATWWAAELPESVGTAKDWLAPMVGTQACRSVTAQEMLVESWGHGGNTEVTLEDLLRIYAPQLIEMAPLLMRRQQQLRDGIADELEQRFRAGGRQAVDDYIVDLDCAAKGLESVWEKFDAYLRAEFPIGERATPDTGS